MIGVMNDNNLIKHYLKVYTFTTERGSLIWSYVFEADIQNYSVELVGFPADYLDDVFLFSVNGASIELRLGGGQLTNTNGRIYINVEFEKEIEVNLMLEQIRTCIYTKLI